MDKDICALDMFLQKPVFTSPRIHDAPRLHGAVKLDRSASLLSRDLSVLILDDDELICRALSRVLKKHVDMVFTACNGNEARRILDAHPVHFLICDFNLGGSEYSGTILTEQLRKQYPTIERAVIFSGNDPGTISTSDAVDEIWHKGADITSIPSLMADIF